MREWEGVVERFYEGEAERAELEALDALDREGTREVAEALQLSSRLRDLCQTLQPPGAPALDGVLGASPVLLEDDDETSEEREALLGDDLTQLLGSMPGPPPISELSLPDLQVVPDVSDEAPIPVELGSFPRSICQGAAAEPSRRLLGEVVEQCGASEATLWVVSEDHTKFEGALNQVRSGEPHAELEGMSVPLSVSAIGKVADTGKSISIGKTDYQDPIASWTVGVEVTAMIAAPVKADGRVVGVVSAVNPTAGEAFNAEALRQLEWRAYLLGLVLQESRRQAPSPLLDGPIS